MRSDKPGKNRNPGFIVFGEIYDTIGNGKTGHYIPANENRGGAGKT
jgi:hypothetical protein